MKGEAYYFVVNRRQGYEKEANLHGSSTTMHVSTMKTTAYLYAPDTSTLLEMPHAGNPQGPMPVYDVALLSWAQEIIAAGVGRHRGFEVVKLKKLELRDLELRLLTKAASANADAARTVENILQSSQSA